MNESDGARMLAEVETANAELAQRARAPLWYHPALGLLMGGLAAVAGQPTPVILAYEAVMLVGLWLLVQAYKRRTGMWVSGYRKGRTRWVAFSLAAACAAVTILSLWLRRAHDIAWAPYVGGMVIFVLATAGGLLWEAAFRRDLRDGGGL
jgi:hypothetical protein